MDILGFIKQFDEAIFLYLNNLPHNYWLDQFFLFFSFHPWLIWLILGIIVILVNERKEKLFIIRLILAIGLAGILCSGIIKPIIKRVRPDIKYGQTVMTVQEKPAMVFWNNDYAFPSGHAAAAFAGAYILTRESRDRKKDKQRNLGLVIIYYSIATITAYSRIYLGKHYPIDVILGGLVGWLMGWVAWRLVDLIKPKAAY